MYLKLELLYVHMISKLYNISKVYLPILTNNLVTYFCNSSEPTFPPDFGFTKAMKRSSVLFSSI